MRDIVRVFFGNACRINRLTGICDVCDVTIIRIYDNELLHILHSYYPTCYKTTPIQHCIKIQLSIERIFVVDVIHHQVAVFLHPIL